MRTVSLVRFVTVNATGTPTIGDAELIETLSGHVAITSVIPIPHATKETPRRGGARVEMIFDEFAKLPERDSFGQPAMAKSQSW
jgi:hypothetical protein